MSTTKTIGRLSETSPRAAAWKAVFGGLDVPLASPFTCRVQLPQSWLKDVYLIDIVALTKAQFGHLVTHLAAAFSLPVREIENDLLDKGCPILAEDVHILFKGRLVT